MRGIADALLAVRAVLLRGSTVSKKRVRSMARSHLPAKLLMTTPAVGPIVALTTIAREDGRERPDACAVDDPGGSNPRRRPRRISG